MHKAYNGVELSDEQVLFLRHVLAGHNVLVDACIGSGKTLSIHEACRRSKGKRIVYFTYNRRLMEEAKGKIKLPNVEICTYHSFAGKYIGKAQKKSKGVRYCLKNLVEWKIPVPAYDIIIVDEYQDISYEMADLLRYVKQVKNNAQIIFVGDMCQKIYESTFNVIEFTREYLGGTGRYVKVKFTKCFRISPEHAQFLGKCWNKSIVGMNTDCKVEFTDNEEYVRSVLAQAEPKDILVLGPNGKGKRNILQNALEWGQSEKFNKFTLYSSIKEDDNFFGYRGDLSKSAIFTTFDSCKGLERDICVVVNWCKGYLKVRQEHKPDLETLKNIMLVAASRGKKHIIFFNPPAELDSDFDTSPLAVEDFRDLRDDDEPDLTACAISNMLKRVEIKLIDDCYSLLSRQLIKAKSTRISVKLHTGWIDLSPLIGMYVDSDFFIKHDLNKEYELVLNFSKKIHWDNSWDTIKKIKCIVANETGQHRYMYKVSNNFISDEAKSQIRNRLLTVFDGTEVVQQPCRVLLTGTKKHEKMLIGLSDVVVGDIVYELKFVRQLQVEHYIQLATYMVALNKEVGRLWNIYDNTMIEVRISDVNKFMRRLCDCVTNKKMVCTGHSVIS